MLLIASILLQIGSIAQAVQISGSLELASTYVSATYQLDAVQNANSALTIDVRFTANLKTSSSLGGGDDNNAQSVLCFQLLSALFQCYIVRYDTPKGNHQQIYHYVYTSTTIPSGADITPNLPLWQIYQNSSKFTLVSSAHSGDDFEYGTVATSAENSHSAGWIWPNSGNVLNKPQTTMQAYMRFEGQTADGDVATKLAMIGNGAVFTETQTMIYNDDYQIVYKSYTQESCSSTQIQSQTITLSNFKYMVSGSQTVPAFVDSVGQNGLCGLKQLTINSPWSNFLTVSYDASTPATSPITITYSIRANEADIGTHTVSYSVTVQNFPTSTPLTGQFTLTIDCPDSVISSSITSNTPSQTYDVSSGSAQALTLPVIAFTPSSCFSITGYTVLDSSNSLLPYITASGTSIMINSQDWTLQASSPHSVFITTLLSEGQAVQQHSFSLSFTYDCNAMTATVVENAYSPSILTYDLLTNLDELIPLPTLTISPPSCAFQTSWVVKRTSDDVDVITTMPNVFSIQGSDLRIQHISTEISVRLALFNNPDLYFVGTISDQASTQTSKKSFSLVLRDDCQSATINTQTITFSSVIYGTDYSQQISAFTDSVDTSGSYSSGICGVKEITIASLQNQILSIQQDNTNPATTPFTLTYTAREDESDIQISIVTYQVSSKYYSAVPSIQDTFTLTIECPPNTLSSIIASQTSNQSYDLGIGIIQSVNEPIVQFKPSVCFTIDSYVITDPSNVALAYISATGTSISLQSKDWSLKAGSPHTVKIQTKLDNNELIGSHDFTINFTYNCATLRSPLVELDNYNPLIATNDLLKDFSVSIPLPTAKITPSDCSFVISWILIRQSDEVVVSNVHAFNFFIQPPNLQLQHKASDITMRHSLFDSTIYSFQGSLSDLQNTQTDHKSIQLAFRDGCRTSAIIPHEINLSSVEYGTSISQRVSAFTDSIDSKNLNSKGLCGEKIISLLGAPPFLSIDLSLVESVIDHFDIFYDNYLASEDDFGTHVIYYEVTSAQYSNQVTSIQGSFNFTLERCNVPQNKVKALTLLLQAQRLTFRAHKEQKGPISQNFIEQITAVEDQLDLCSRFSLSHKLNTPYAFIDGKSNEKFVSLQANLIGNNIGNFTEAYIAFTRGTFQVNLPIQVELIVCEVKKLRFEVPQITIHYIIGSGEQVFGLPKLLKEPDCDLAIDRMTVTQAQELLQIDVQSNELIVDSDDETLAWQTLDVTIIPESSHLSQSQVQGIFVSINFASKVDFDQGKLNTESLKCSEEDESWSVGLFDGLESIEGISSVEIPNLGSDSIFELQEPDRVQLTENALGSFEWCEQMPYASFELVLRDVFSQVISVQRIGVRIGSDSLSNLKDKDGDQGLQIVSHKLSSNGILFLQMSQPFELDLKGMDINEVLWVKIKSEDDLYFESASNKINSVELVEAASQTFKLKIDFSNPDTLSTSINDPDQLMMQIFRSSVFIDPQTRQALPINQRVPLSLTVEMKKQYSEEQYEELEAQLETASTSGIVFALWAFILMLVLSEYIAIMRVLILTIQPLVTILYWQIRFPELTYMILYELKRMVYGEVIDDLEISDQIYKFIGLEVEEHNSVDAMTDQLTLKGISLAEIFGVTNIILTILLTLLILIILAAHRISQHLDSPGCKRRTDRMMKAVFFNSFIEFQIFEAIKLNLATMVATGGSDTIFGSIVLAMINVVPILYLVLLYKRRNVLGANKNIESIGSLYSGFNVNREDHRVYLQPVYFTYRRTMISLATVFLENYPNLQMIVSTSFSLAMVVIMAWDKHLFKSNGQRFLKITSEMLHLIILIILQQYIIPDYSEHIEILFIATISSLLGVHQIYLWVNVMKNMCRKMRMKRLKKAYEAKALAMVRAKQELEEKKLSQLMLMFKQDPVVQPPINRDLVEIKIQANTEQGQTIDKNGEIKEDVNDILRSQQTVGAKKQRNKLFGRKRNRAQMKKIEQGEISMKEISELYHEINQMEAHRRKICMRKQRKKKQTELLE